MDTAEQQERDSTIEGLAQLAPHLEDFIAGNGVTSPEEKVTELMDSLLKDGECFLPIRDVSDAATEAGMSTAELLSWAEKSDTCYVDYVTGFIRCNDDGEEEEEEEEEE